MRWGRVEITAGALLLWALLYYLDSGTLVPQALAACALHELGHYAAIRLLGGRVARLKLSCVGAEMALSARCPLGPARELAATLAGPAVNLLCAWICSGLGEAWWCFTGLHLALGLFNLLPVGPLDGGRALNCLLTLAAIAKDLKCRGASPECSVTIAAGLLKVQKSTFLYQRGQFVLCTYNFFVRVL